MNKVHRVRCVVWNAQSVNNKILNLLQILDDDSIDICFLTETWLKTQYNYVTAALAESGFKITHNTRTAKKGGGVAVISRNNIESKFEKSPEYTSFECIIQSFRTKKNHGNLTAIVIYRPESHSENISAFLDELYSLIEYAQLNFKNYLICGDFNVHVNKLADSTTIKFQDVLKTFSLNQSVNTATHKYGNTLDLILHDPECININNVHVDSTLTLKSDHFPIHFDVEQQISCSEQKSVEYRNVKDVVIEDLNADLTIDSQTFVQNADGNNFQASLDLYNNMFGSTINKHAPLTTKTLQDNNRPPWMDTEFLDARKKRRQLYKKWKKSRSDEDREEFVHSRSYVNQLSFEKRRSFYQNSISNSNNSQKDLYKVTNSLLDRNTKSVLPHTENPTSLANKFNNFFIEKIENIRNNLVAPNDYSVQRTVINNVNVPSFSTFKPVSSEEVQKMISARKIKTCPRDPIPAFLLRSSIMCIITSLVFLINVSLSIGSMEGLKDSVITPILKKAGLDPESLSNYRPVCSSLYIDKLIQSSVLVQLNDHMSKFALHVSQQSGYKTYHSCETVLLRILNDVLISLDSGVCSVLLLLDLSAAFDTVDHNILLDILSEEIGLKGTVLNWFASFLSGRTQSTKVGGTHSDRRDMRYGVPQGSVLGPVLFNIYVRNFISTLQRAGFVVHGYADDHQLLYTFRIQFQYHAICHYLPVSLDIIYQWMSSHFLKLNAGKSQLLIFTPQNIRDKLHIDRVYLGKNVFIPVSIEATNLGVKLDSSLTFSPHINMVISQSYKQISNIGQIRRYLEVDHVRTVVQALIVSKIDNCNSLLYGVSEYEISRLQKLQNSCARLIFGKKKFESVTELLSKLHWLPIKQRIYFKILLLVFKFFKNKTPSYINERLHVTNFENFTLKISRTNTQYGDRAFENCAPKLWEALPLNIKNLNTIESFKKHLKHHLFENFHEFKCKVDRYKT